MSRLKRVESMTDTVNNLDEIVELIMDAYNNTHSDTVSPLFELRVRKALMKRFCTEMYKQPMTWTGNINSTRKEMLHG